jgi:hypothetical protein
MTKKKQTPALENEQSETVVTEIVTAEVKRSPGRPVVEGSARQLKLAAQEAKRLTNGGEIKRGRPVSNNSKRQQKLTERAAKLAQGLVIKPGRPKAVEEKQNDMVVDIL